MIRGLESVSANEVELFRVLSASKLETLWKLRLPRALPFLFSSLRISSATAVIGAVVGEWIGSDKGLGAMIIQATFNYQSGRLYAATDDIGSSQATQTIQYFTSLAICEGRTKRHTHWAGKRMNTPERTGQPSSCR
jgi:hypothetical protein